jgi:hypothetical protein
VSRTACIIGLITLFLILAGCTSPESQNNTAASTPVTPAQTPVPPPVFPKNPIDLHGRLQVPGPVGSFEESYIGTSNCTNDTETFETNYEFVSGSDGSHLIRLQLVPIENWGEMKEIQMPEEIQNASIVPAEFIAEPNHLYTVGVRIMFGPNVTGESYESPSGEGWAKNPYFTFLLRAYVDGVRAPEADDRISVTKWCYYYDETREMLRGPSVDYGENEVTMSPSDKRAVNLSFWSSNEGIEELRIRIPGQLINRTYWNFPITSDELKPFPQNMTITFNPPVTIGRNFQRDNVTMVVTTGPLTPAGEYSFPLELCYRTLDPSDPSAPHFPFSEQELCPTAGEFTVSVEK